MYVNFWTLVFGLGAGFARRKDIGSWERKQAKRACWKEKAEATQTAQKPDTDAAKDSAVAVELLVGDLVITKSSKKKAKYDNQSGEVISVSKNHIKVLLKTGDSAGEHHRFEKANVVKKENKPVVKRPLQSEVSDADAKRQKAAELFGADKLDDIKWQQNGAAKKRPVAVELADSFW